MRVVRTLDDPRERGKLRLDLLMLARHAEVQNGLVNLLGGGWDTLTAPSGGEATLDGSVAVRLLLDPAEAGQAHELRIVVAAEDGAELGDFGGSFEVPPAADDWEANVCMALHITGLGLPAAGRYAVRLEVDGEPLGERRFRVERS
jgi:hypothetical protein